MEDFLGLNKNVKDRSKPSKAVKPPYHDIGNDLCHRFTNKKKLSQKVSEKWLHVNALKVEEKNLEDRNKQENLN